MDREVLASLAKWREIFIPLCGIEQQTIEKKDNGRMKEEEGEPKVL